MLGKKQITALQQEILDWYAKNKRDLPWRRTRDPYAILISEVMLQQTQVGRVIQKYEEWMDVFPTITALAQASTRDVLLHWSGLGYNRRALYLKKLAEGVVGLRGGLFPRSEKELMALPGIGQYTARAILCFAFDEQIAVVDTNVRKVILTKSNDIQDNPKEIQKIADMLLPQERAYEWNQALMDYSSAMLKKEKITIPKQKPFKNSDRFFRGEILRQLLLQETLSEKKLFALLNEKSAIATDRLQKVLEGMEKDNLIARKENMIILPES